MAKQIDWDKVDKESERCLNICEQIDNDIEQQRKKTTDIKDLEKQTKDVNKFIKDNNLDFATLKLNNKKRS